MESEEDWEIKRREFWSHTFLFLSYRVMFDVDVDVNESGRPVESIFCVKVTVG